MSAPYHLGVLALTHHSGLSPPNAIRRCVRRLSRQAVDLNLDGHQARVTGVLDCVDGCCCLCCAKSASVVICFPFCLEKPLWFSSIWDLSFACQESCLADVSHLQWTSGFTKNVAVSSLIKHCSACTDFNRSRTSVEIPGAVRSDAVKNNR